MIIRCHDEKGYKKLKEYAKANNIEIETFEDVEEGYPNKYGYLNQQELVDDVMIRS